MEKRFRIELNCYHWSCGDGCCSDSGMKVLCWDRDESKVIYENNEWKYNYYYGSQLENILECIEKIIGRVPVEDEDYEIEMFSSDDRNEWPDNIGWRKD